MQRLERIIENLNLPTSPLRIVGRINEFTLPENAELGVGKTSEPILVNYLGSNPAILKFGNPLVLKRGKLAKTRTGSTQHSLQYEIENIDALNERHPNVALKQVVIGATIDLVSDEGLETAIIAPVITYSPNEVPKNAYQYVNLAVLNSHPQFRHFQLARTLNDLAMDMQTALQELHGLGYLHLDGALRNYMMSAVKTEGKGRFSLKLIDLGLARPIVTDKGLATLLPVDQPLRILNHSALYAENSKRYVSILTDLFQMRCMMLELAGTSMGLNHNEILGLKDKEGKEVPFTHYQEARRHFATDNVLLKNLTDSLIDYLRGQEKKDTKAAPLLCWLLAYYPFITQLPACAPDEVTTLDGALAVAERDLKFFKAGAKEFETAIAAAEKQFIPPSLTPIARHVSLSQLHSDPNDDYADIENTAAVSLNSLEVNAKLFGRRKSFSELAKYQNLLETVKSVVDTLIQDAEFNVGAGFNRINQEVISIDVGRMNQSQCKLRWEEIVKIATEQTKKIHVTKNLRQFYQCIQDENVNGLDDLKTQINTKRNLSR